MNDDLKFAIILGVSVVLAVVMVGVVGYFASGLSCDSRWHRSGMNSEYEFFTGCLVQREDGTWSPENVLRDVQ